MVEVAAHLTDHVLPPLPIRQWVLSLPKGIRPFLPRDPHLAGAVLRILLRAIRTTLRRTSPGAPPDAQLGAVSFLHRFASALNAHFHFHVAVLDGLFSDSDGTVTFHEATHLTADDVLRLQRTLQRRVLRLFQRRGLLDEPTVADMLTWQASGDFSLDASLRIHGSDSAGRERLLRYCARPPFALERLHIEPPAHERNTASPPGEAAIRQVRYHPARPMPEGARCSSSRPSSFSPPSADSSRRPASTATAHWPTLLDGRGRLAAFRLASASGWREPPPLAARRPVVGQLLRPARKAPTDDRVLRQGT
jgi:Putative transposase